MLAFPSWKVLSLDHISQIPAKRYLKDAELSFQVSLLAPLQIMPRLGPSEIFTSYWVLTA